MDVKENLKKLIDVCGDAKRQKKEFENVEKATIADIKKAMGENNLDLIETDNYKAKYTISKSKSLDEQALLQYISTEMGDFARQLGLIKTREYLDNDALETAIYRGDISADTVKEFSQFEQIKRTPRLTISKI